MADPDKFLEVENTISAATVTWEERDSSATSSAGRFLAEDFLPLVLIVRTAQVREYNEQMDGSQKDWGRNRDEKWRRGDRLTLYYQHPHPSHSKSIASSPTERHTSEHPSSWPSDYSHPP